MWKVLESVPKKKTLPDVSDSFLGFRNIWSKIVKKIKENEIKLKESTNHLL